MAENLRRAVFLDRDGVLNRNVWYPDTEAWESPRALHEFALADGVLPALAMLREAGFLLFLVSNQPNAVNGKSPPGTLEAMHARLTEALRGAGLAFSGTFYCTHHPRYTGPCPCRKPSPFFLEKAACEHGLALAQCWMVGDRATDMECGHAAGTRTAWVNTGQEPHTPDRLLVDVQGRDFPDVSTQVVSALGAER